MSVDEGVIREAIGLSIATSDVDSTPMPPNRIDLGSDLPLPLHTLPMPFKTSRSPSPCPRASTETLSDDRITDRSKSQKLGQRQQYLKVPTRMLGPVIIATGPLRQPALGAEWGA